MTAENREAIVTKINKLLEMTERNGATQAEAVQFALKAQQLMAEHDIEEYELGIGVEEPIVSVQVGSSSTRQWRDILARIVAENFRCKFYFHCERKEGRTRRSTYVNFYGYRHDAQAAALVFERLYEIGDKLAREYVKNEKRRREFGAYRLNTKLCYDSFAVSFANGVRSELEKQTQALMLVRSANVDEAYELLSEGFDKGRKARLYMGDPKAEEEGYIAGRDAVRSGRLGEASDTYLLNA